MRDSWLEEYQWEIDPTRSELNEVARASLKSVIARISEGMVQEVCAILQDALRDLESGRDRQEVTDRFKEALKCLQEQ